MSETTNHNARLLHRWHLGISSNILQGTASKEELALMAILDKFYEVAIENALAAYAAVEPETNLDWQKTGQQIIKAAAAAGIKL